MLRIFFFQMGSCSWRCSCCCEGNVKVIFIFASQKYLNLIYLRSECKKNSTFASRLCLFHIILNKRLHVRISGKDPTDTQTPWMNVTEGPDYYAHAQTLATSWRHPTQKCTEHTVRFNGKIWRVFEINWRFDHRRKHTRHTESRRVWLNELELYLNHTCQPYRFSR